MTDTSPPISDQDIQGLDDDTGWGEYPIDTLLIRHEQRTVHDVVRRITQGTFVMDPDFQRDFIWPDDKQSKLIESVLMRIPLPVFYLAEDAQGRMIVVDGLQRLSTFTRFINNELQLKLPHQSELHGKTFRELTTKFQNRIEDCNLVLYVVDAKVPERARLDIFDRVNSGVPLTRQQMRNSLYMGPASTFLKEEAATDLFIKATGGSLRSDTMRDREFVNRFCAFYLLDLNEYKGEINDFLGRALTLMNTYDQQQLASLSADFRNTLHNNFHLFGTQAFRKHEAGQERRGIVNAALWDVMSTCLAPVPHDKVQQRAQTLRDRFYSLMGDRDFDDAITYGPGTPHKVRHRFDVMRRTVAEVFND